MNAAAPRDTASPRPRNGPAPGEPAPSRSAPADTPRRRRLSSADRRASILAAAAEVFAETGYAQGKVSEVAARLGVSEPVVFQNFGSKAALYAAVLDHAAGQMAAAIRAGTGPDGSVGTLLSRMLAPGHLDELHTRGGPGVLFADAVALTAEPEVERSARQAVRQVADALTDLLTRGQETGEVRPDLDPATGSWWLLTMLAAHGFRSAVMPDRERIEADLSHFTLRVLAGPAGTAEPAETAETAEPAGTAETAAPRDRPEPPGARPGA